MRPRTILLAVAVASAAPTVFATELPVTAVTLSSTGLAQTERAGLVQPDAPVTLRVPVEDVDDLLRTLIVRDAGGTVEGFRLGGRDVAEEAFRGLPLRRADFETRLALFTALVGHEVEAGGIRGRLLAAQEGDGGLLRLTVVTATGLTTIAVQEAAAVRLADPQLAERVGRAAAAVAAVRTEDERTIELVLRGAVRAREVSVTYVAAAPLWKPSYRLLAPLPGETAGQARLQGWAVVENRSGTDWNGVWLTLVSGDAAAFRQPLYDPILVPRIEVPVRVAEAFRVRPDTGGRPAPPAPAPSPAASAQALRGFAMRGRAEADGAYSVTEAAASPAAPPSSLQSAEAVSTAGGRVSYALPLPISVGTGQTANLPFLDVALPAERVWWVQDGAWRRPLQAVRIRNATAQLLPDGLVAVHGAGGAEAGAFLGDAEMRALSPGDGRLLAFARDRDLQITDATQVAERPTRIDLRRGSVVFHAVRREELALAVDPKGGRGTLVVDLPRRADAQPRFEVAAEGDFGLRSEVRLTGTPMTLRFPFEREVRQDVPLWDPGLGDPTPVLLGSWRTLENEAGLRRLPGWPGTLERLREALVRLPADLPGRDRLVVVIGELDGVRRLLDQLRSRFVAHQAAEAVLERARQAVEDRTGPEREEARRRLNRASLDVEAAGTATDGAWLAWQRAAQALLAREG